MNELKLKFLKCGKALGRYKYALVILLVGVLLIKAPFERERVVAEAVPYEDRQDLQAQMEQILSCIHGAGEVKVLLSKESGMMYAYQEDEQIERRSDGEEIQTQTVLLKADEGQIPLETMCTYPTYRGALILCQGADKPSVKYAIVQAVAGLTGLGSDHISVIKMKGQ